jgi:hypothetical protein
VAELYETRVAFSQIKMPVSLKKRLPSSFLSLKKECFEEVGLVIIKPITISSIHLAESKNSYVGCHTIYLYSLIAAHPLM